MASRTYRDEVGKPVAMRCLLKDVHLQRIAIDLHAGNASGKTILALEEQPAADTLTTSKGNGALVYNLIMRARNWAGPDARCARER